MQKSNLIKCKCTRAVYENNTTIEGEDIFPSKTEIKLVLNVMFS